MQKPTLVIMAAGLGSRYGGLKQIAPVDEAGHVIMDFSIFDAVRAGFGRVVCVVKPENEREFREVIGRRVENHVEMRYAAQSLDMLPAGLRVPEGRIKPWGTGHAVLCARKYVDGPFAVINADDFYGRTAFAAICDFLAADGDPCEHAMVGYRLSNTLTENGAVSRGVCQVSPDGYLAQIVERTRIEARGGAPAYTEDGGRTFVSLPADATVSMNLWGFRSSILPEMERGFARFLTEKLPAAPLKAEYYLPSAPDELIHAGRARVRVLSTQERWFGITYPEDMAAVRAAVAAKKASGEYPEHLWK